MNKSLLLAALSLAWLTTAASAGSAPANSRPLTPQEIRKVFIGHTWSGTVSGKPGVMSAAEKKASAQLKGKPTGRFKEYYAPNGKIMGWAGRTDFDAYSDGTWSISGNELCASYKVNRIWKVGDVRSSVSTRWCYRFVYSGSKLLMAASKTPAGRSGEIGQYFAPRLSPGNSVSPNYNAVKR